MAMMAADNATTSRRMTGEVREATTWRVSVIIPTYNRATHLVDCLEALVAQATGQCGVEVVVVDNNSTDGTEGAVRRFLESHEPCVARYVLEPRQGLTHARNRGVAEARGEVVCFLDDDAIPTPGWLTTVMEAFDDPGIGCVGGPMVPDYQGQVRPPWLNGDLQGMVGGFRLPYAAQRAVSAVTELPWGGNMAFRRTVFEDVGLFRPDLDPSGVVRLVGGETELITRVCRAGWTVAYLPGAAVLHRVMPSQLEKAYIFREAKVLAATHVVLTHDSRITVTVRWFLSDLWYATRLLVKLMAALARRSPLWFDDYVRFWAVAQRIPIRATRFMRGTRPAKQSSAP